MRTAHGPIATPALLPALWSRSSSGLLADELREVGTQAVQISSYTMLIRPDLLAVVRTLGGVHRFAGWSGPILSDAGLFPTELAERARIVRSDEEGLTLTSYIDGSRHRLTPEGSVQIQEALGADIMLVLDDPRVSGERRTGDWTRRSVAARTTPGLLFGRVRSTEAAAEVSQLALDGAVLDRELLERSPGLPLPEHWPRHARDVGDPLELLAGVRAGLDLFDSAASWRLARHGSAYTAHGPLRVVSLDPVDNGPIEIDCQCLACAGGYTRGYLRHLVAANELLAYTLLGAHNLFFVHDLLRKAREATADRSLVAFVDAYRNAYATSGSTPHSAGGQ